MQIIETGVGPISEADIANAASTRAVILGFDVPCSGPVAKRAEAANIRVRLHRLIYKFTDDVDTLFHDVQIQAARARGENTLKDVTGAANVL